MKFISWFKFAVIIIIILTPIIIFGWLLNQYLIPTGIFVVNHPIDQKSPFINRLLPDQRVEEIRTDTEGDVVQAVIEDPVFFYVHPHRGFENVEMEVWFKNQDNPIVELGGLARVDPEIYDLKPLQNLTIDRLDWPRFESGDLVLFQKVKNYKSIDEFIENPPLRHEIATYHYKLAQPYLIPGYQPVNSIKEIDVSLRGFHEFKAYIKNEELFFEISFMDMNRSEGADPVVAVVFAEDGTPVTEARVNDDGDISDQARPSEIQKIVIKKSDLPEGVYKVELRANRDIFFRTFKTIQQKLVFLNNLYLADEVGYKPNPRPVSFWTEAKDLVFQTQHSEGLQEVSVENNYINVEFPYQRYVYDVKEKGVVKSVVPKGDMIIHSNGHIAFTPEQFFNPDPVRLTYSTDLDKLDIKYIIAKYVPPETVGNWKVAKANFDPSVLTYVEEGTWKFVFSVPGIGHRQGQLDIGKINMKLIRQPLYDL